MSPADAPQQFLTGRTSELRDEQHDIAGPSRRLLEEMLPTLAALHHPRSVAYAAIGLSRPRSDVLGEAGEKLLEPGLKYGVNTTTKIDFISLSLALVLGTAGLPHVLQRFYTVPTSKQARKSVEWAIWLIGGFYLLTLVVGYGAGALVGAETINAAPGKANSAAPLLAFELGGVRHGRIGVALAQIDAHDVPSPAVGSNVSSGARSPIMGFDSVSSSPSASGKWHATR